MVNDIVYTGHLLESMAMNGHVSHRRCCTKTHLAAPKIGLLALSWWKVGKGAQYAECDGEMFLMVSTGDGPDLRDWLCRESREQGLWS